jgi:formylglycine-generating enzyme required for sulfatase activity
MRGPVCSLQFVINEIPHVLTVLCLDDKKFSTNPADAGCGRALAAMMLLRWDACWHFVRDAAATTSTALNHLNNNHFDSLTMKQTALMFVFLLGLSTFLPTVQAQGQSGAETAPTPNGEEGEGAGKQDINEVLKTGTEFTNSVGMVMKKAGSLWISSHETTQKNYQEVTGSNPSTFQGEKHPVDSVSWNDAVDFCQKLTTHEREKEMLPDGYAYLLPTQAQWESLASGVPLQDAVTSANGSRASTAEVGSLPPSGAGLYDLRGNVAEWCADPADGAYRVLRGGSWDNWIDINLRLDFRVYEAPSVAKNSFGFRCVLIEGK